MTQAQRDQARMQQAAAAASGTRPAPSMTGAGAGAAGGGGVPKASWEPLARPATAGHARRHQPPPRSTTILGIAAGTVPMKASAAPSKAPEPSAQRHWPSFLAEESHAPAGADVADALAAFSPLAASGGVSATKPFAANRPAPQPGARLRPQSAAATAAGAGARAGWRGGSTRPSTASRVR